MCIRDRDVDADEVTIGRKYYRSGDSEYTINGQVCRLRDVYELLLDTGIGRDQVIRHYDITGKLCPLYFVEHKDAWNQFLQDVADY